MGCIFGKANPNVLIQDLMKGSCSFQTDLQCSHAADAVSVRAMARSKLVFLLIVLQLIVIMEGVNETDNAKCE